METETFRDGRDTQTPSPTVVGHLDPEDFDQEVGDLLGTSGRAHVSRFGGHTDVHSDLEVVLLLAHEGLVGAGVEEALVRVHAVGRRRPGDEDTFGLHSNRDACLCFHTHSVWKLLEKTVHHRSGLYWSHFRCWFSPTLGPPAAALPKRPSASSPAGGSSDSDLLLFFLSVELEQRNLLSEGLRGPGPTTAVHRTRNLLASITEELTFGETEPGRRSAYQEGSMEEEPKAQVEGGVARCATGPEDVPGVS